MGSIGRANYNRNKLAHPIDKVRINSAKLTLITPSNFLDKYRGRKLDGYRKGLLRSVEIINIAYVERDAIHIGNTMIQVDRDDKWLISLSPQHSLMADPRFNPENVYLSGRGHESSILFYNNKWWSILACERRKQGSTHKDVLILHEVNKNWDPKNANLLKQQILDSFSNFKV